MADDLLLPPPLAADRRLQAMGVVAQRMSGLDISPVLVYLVDTVNTSVLPGLAEQFHILGEGWQFARNDDERRLLLKRAIELHRYKGTPWAIKQVLETLSLNGQIREWFDYGGQPFYFRIDVDLSDRGIDEATYDALVELVTEYKNVRSHLEALTLSLTVRSPVPAIAAVTLGGELTTVYPLQLDGVALASAIFIGYGQRTIEMTTIYPLEN